MGSPGAVAGAVVVCEEIGIVGSEVTLSTFVEGFPLSLLLDLLPDFPSVLPQSEVFTDSSDGNPSVSSLGGEILLMAFHDIS